MSDQLRADHLSCEGNARLHTPNIDALAARGVRFGKAFCQSAVCGPSRISFYTGRYPTSHGVTWNSVPLPVGQVTMGEMLRPLGLRVALCGKSHVVPDMEGLTRLGIDPKSDIGVLLVQGGFEPYDRHEGHIAPPPESHYNQYLAAKGYKGANPWEEYANSALDENGSIVSGWWLRNSHLPARVKREHSETAYMTDRTVAFIADMGEKPWALHLSYIKPHWPYLAPAPYNDMYGIADSTPLNRTDAERENAHPVVRAYAEHDECQSFARDEVLREVRPPYMGLVKELDDQIGRLMTELKRLGRLDDTLIVFTADHGDFLGDHWLGEKEIMYEEAVRIPLIVVDPDARADATRGTVSDALVESIDCLPTFIAALGREPPSHLIEGQSLLPFTRGGVSGWRDAAICELDYSFREARRILKRGPRECRATMVRTARWKYIDWEGFAPQLFDLAEDPQEQHDLGTDTARTAIRREMHDRLDAWRENLKLRVTASDEYVLTRTNTHRKRGIHIGIW